MNKENKKPEGLEDYSEILELETPVESNFSDVVGQDSLTRFDKPKAKKKRRKGRNNSNRNPRNNNNKPQNKN
jgi:hypothetical protein